MDRPHVTTLANDYGAVLDCTSWKDCSVYSVALYTFNALSITFASHRAHFARIPPLSTEVDVRLLNSPIENIPFSSHAPCFTPPSPLSSTSAGRSVSFNHARKVGVSSDLAICHSLQIQDVHRHRNKSQCVVIIGYALLRAMPAMYIYVVFVQSIPSIGCWLVSKRRSDDEERRACVVMPIPMSMPILLYSVAPICVESHVPSTIHPRPS